MLVPRLRLGTQVPEALPRCVAWGLCATAVLLAAGLPAAEGPKPQVATSKTGLVASVHPLATDAGVA
ncbi:MAG TPA: hypothetical protein VFV87_01370, partial [Pirellulaceae bacterium]|nr:hypothetical protein [Pirellulaceae bacterium]